MEPLRVGIVGFGNLGKAVETSLLQQPDMTLAGVFSRRQIPHPQYRPIHTLDEKQVEVDVLLLCGGSAKDLPLQTPHLAQRYNVVDSFDTHALMRQHFEATHRAASHGRKVALLAAGWDPGLFSMMRCLFESVLPNGQSASFWGPGISQGHSDALRQLPGVKDARQYTLPNEEALSAAREGKPVSKAHQRLCYVVPEEGAHLEQLVHSIKTLPYYFAGYETQVVFISQEELLEKHAEMPQAGHVIRKGSTQDAREHLLEFSLKLSNNPAFTASVLTACARATCRLHQQGATGAYTLLDIPLASLSPSSPEELRQRLV
ncbi:MAG: diaminopimelate dehydrogenase [Proteobacteria bacterium]|nr:diaminopimelate dehydrogenase [Cystobacterineae bacterium]MCL2259107.1 diaminopimelate dehydrogenase [Cystobacterineae bacterium]MCL2314501.1 diaminopimelate dehydrogenase [Pseudomonadota bacterium]